jgi:hypothetical protein
MMRGSTVLSYVAMQHCPDRESGTIRTCQRKQSIQGGEKRYPDGPDGHDTLHITLALCHRPGARLTTIACRGSGGLEDLVGVVDVEEQVGETEDWDYGAHVVGLTTVVPPIKVPLYACKNRDERAEREVRRSSSLEEERRRSWMRRSFWTKCGIHEARRVLFGVSVTPGLSTPATMPKIRTSRTKRPPEGFEDIESVSLRCTRLVFLGG